MLRLIMELVSVKQTDNMSNFFSGKLQIFSYPSVLTNVLGAQKPRLIETVLFSTHNICFG